MQYIFSLAELCEPVVNASHKQFRGKSSFKTTVFTVMYLPHYLQGAHTWHFIISTNGMHHSRFNNYFVS